MLQEGLVLPSGEIASINGTAFDFREAHAVGRDIGPLTTVPIGGGKFLGGYDHNWVSLPPKLCLLNLLLQGAAGATDRGGSPAKRQPPLARPTALLPTAGALWAGPRC